MKTLNKVQTFIFVAGGILALVGAATYITGWPVAFYLYAAGAVAFSVMQLYAGYTGDNLVVRRLRLQQVTGALLLMITAVLMAMHTLQFGFARHNEWVVAFAIACVLELYTAFRIPSELDKENAAKKRQ